MKSLTAFVPTPSSGASSIQLTTGIATKPIFAGRMASTSVSSVPGWFASHAANCSCDSCTSHTAGCQCASCGTHVAGCVCSSCTVGHSFGCHCSACVSVISY